MEGDAGESNRVLGKRKEREDGAGEGKNLGSTLFVSNLPYNATSTDLQTLFSDLAPVRSAFVVLEGDVSKGVGYVSFAIREDAASAMETIEKDGLTLEGRKLRVQWAERRFKDKSGEVVKSESKKPTVPKSFIPKLPKDPNAIQTIVISGLPSSIDQKTLWKKVRKYDGAESAQLVEGETGVAHALFKSPAFASRAVEKLHAHVFKGAILSVTLKKRLETLAKAPAKDKSADGKNSNPIPNRASRLIIRNLPWGITEQELRALFLPYGPIYSITIPTTQSEDGKKPRDRGFAFVWFFSKKDAERAIESVNGRSVAAGAITAPTMNKKERARLRRKLREEQKNEENGDDEDGEGEDDHEKEDSVKLAESKKSEPRVVAVDWALSKEKWEEAKSQGLISQVADDDEEEGSRSDAESKDGSQDEDGDDGEEEEGMDVDDMSVDERSDEDQPGKPALPQTDVGTTLFIRNVPFDATEDELRTLFRAFGPLRYARITMDHELGRSRGTGFVCFWKKEDADKAIHQSELLNREVGLEAPKKNPFSMPSLLTPDPSSSLAQSLVLHGRTLDVTRAVTRDVAQKLKDEGERAREKADKRNLYLLREGVIFPNSPAAASLPPAELEKRSSSFNTRRALLKSNPSLFVSKTRMSIRQLPPFTTERSLKRLAIHAVRTFESEVKSGARQPLTEDELREDTTPPEDDFEQNHGSDSEVEQRKAKRSKRVFKGRDSGVKQAKIVRQSDRIDVLTGKGKSKGYGFLEMNKHSDALRVLRWANNNPAVGKLLEEWWKIEVEESVKRIGEEGKKKEHKNVGDEQEEVETRLRRLKDELEQLKSGGGKKGLKALIIEFSIENAQVVNRRKEKQGFQKSETKEETRDGEESNEDQDEDTSRSNTKKRKVQDSALERKKVHQKGGIKDDAPAKRGNTMGGLIGRKRKLRKQKSKA